MRLVLSPNISYKIASGLVRMRYIESDGDLSLRGAALRKAIAEDIQIGLIPFWVCATLGTTGACAFDNLDEVSNNKIRLDAAYKKKWSRWAMCAWNMVSGCMWTLRMRAARFCAPSIVCG